MNHVWYILSALFLCLLSCTQIHQGSSSSQSSIPIYLTSICSAPLLEVTVEKVPLILKLDLGASCELMLKKRALDLIHSKNFLKNAVGYDIQGNQYLQPKFELIDFHLGSFVFETVTAIEENPFFVKEGSKLFGKNKARTDREFATVDGRIGARFFSSSAIFLNLKHSQFSIAKTFEEFSLTPIFETPIFLENGLISIELLTEYGKKRFILDTAASASLANASSFPKSRINIIDGSIGKVYLRTFAFPTSLNEYDGILGLDFFNKAMICIDFQKRKFYIASRTK